MPKEVIDWTTIIITVVTALGSSSVYKIYKRHMDSQDSKGQNQHTDGIAFRKTLLRQIEELKSTQKELNDQVLVLTKENAELRTLLNNKPTN